MTLAGTQFILALVAGKPDERLPVDGILMLDDTAQRIYPSGYRPRWANLDFTGYSDTINTHYRNSQVIFEAAWAVRGKTVIGK